MTTEDLIDRKRHLHEAYLAACPGDPLHFIRGLTIPSAHGPRLFSLCMQPFQRETFEALAPSLLAVRDGDLAPKRRFWLERTKKAGKDADLACCLAWLTAFPVKPLLCQVVASDRDQAAIIKRRVADLLFYNPWLNDYLYVQQNRILSKAVRPDGKPLAEVVIEATDLSGGAHGETPDLLILNELVHVKRWSVMKAHRDNADGVPRSVVIILTNAGVKGTEAEAWRNEALANPERWSVHIWHRRAPWTSDADVADARKRDPIGGEYSRLWEGKWISGIGNAVDQDAIDRCFVLDGPLEGPEPGSDYVAAIDLGVSHDHSGLAVLGANEAEQRIKVALVKGWEPSIPNDKGTLEVDSDAVEEACVDAWKTFGIRWFGYDPAAGGSFMAQRLRKRGVPMVEMSFASPTNLTAMATSFVLVVKDGRLECYEDPEGRTRRDFGKFSIRHDPPSKYKLESVSDEYGHADVGTALVICLPEAVRMLGGLDRLRPDDNIAFDDTTPLTKEEVKSMPDELRELYDVEADASAVGLAGRRNKEDDWEDW